MQSLWENRFTIRFQSHGVPEPEDTDENNPEEYFDNKTLPLAWTKWLDLPETLAPDASLKASDARITEGQVDLCRQSSRKQSPLMHTIMDCAWESFLGLSKDKEARREILGLFGAKGDVSKLQRFVSLAIDGFENEDGMPDVDLIVRLRDFVLFFLHNPTSDSATGFNANIKKRVTQWYRNPPETSGPCTESVMWNRLLVRTPAARDLTKLLETRRFYARSQRPLVISYNLIATVCRYLFQYGDIWRKSVALMFALGTRPNELFRSFIEFKPAGKKERAKNKHINQHPHQWIIQKGSSKGKNASKMMLEKAQPDEEKRVACKPILFGFTSHDVIETINQLRVEASEEFKSSEISSGLTMEEAPTSALSLTVVQKLTRVMYSCFPDEGTEVTERQHLFGGMFSRKFYACAALLEFREAYEGQTTPSLFVADILMHQPGLPTDSVHYVTLELLYGDSDQEFEPDDLFEEGTLNRKRRVIPAEDSKNKKEKKKDEPLFTQTDEEVILKTQSKEKSKVTVFRFIHRRFVSEEERQQYYCHVKQYLMDLNIRPSIANLTAIGVSPQFQAARKKALKTAQANLEEAKEDIQAMSDEVNALEKEVNDIETEGESTDSESEEEEPIKIIRPMPITKKRQMSVLPEPPRSKKSKTKA